MALDSSKIHFANFFGVFTTPATDLTNGEIGFNADYRLVFKDLNGVLHLLPGMDDYLNIYNPDTITITQTTASSTIGIGTEGDYSDKVTVALPYSLEVVATGIHERQILIQYDKNNVLKDILPIPTLLCKLDAYADIFDVNTGIVHEIIKKTDIVIQPTRTALTNTAIFRVIELETAIYNTSFNYPMTTEANRDSIGYINHTYQGADGYLYIIKSLATTEIAIPFTVYNKRTSVIHVRYPTTFFLFEKGDKFTMKTCRRYTATMTDISYEFIASSEPYVISEILKSAEVTAERTAYVPLTISPTGKSINGLIDGAYYDLIVSTTETKSFPTLLYKILDISDGFFNYIFKILKDISNNSSGVGTAINSGSYTKYMFLSTFVCTAEGTTQFVVPSTVYDSDNGDTIIPRLHGLILDEDVDYTFNKVTGAVTLAFELTIGEKVETIIFKYVEKNQESVIITGLQSSIDLVQTELTTFKSDIGITVNNHITDDKTAHGLYTGIVNSPILNFGMNHLDYAGNLSQDIDIIIRGRDYTNLFIPPEIETQLNPLWATLNTYISTSSNPINKISGRYGVSITLFETSGKAGIISNGPFLTKLDPDKYYAFIGHVKNNASSSVYLSISTNGTSMVVKNSLLVTTSTLTRTCARIQPSDWGVGSSTIDVVIVVEGSIGSGANADDLMFVEITDSDYLLTDTELMTKYPYTDGYGALANPYFKNTNNNLIQNGNTEDGLLYWNKQNLQTAVLTIESGKFKLTGSDAGNLFYQRIYLRENTDYYLQSVVSGITVVKIMDSKFANQIAIGNTTFNSGSNTIAHICIYNSVSGAGYANGIILREGTVAPTAYETQLSEQFSLEKNDLYWGNKDWVKIASKDIVDGKIWSKHKSLMGRDNLWKFKSSSTGFKIIELLHSDSNIQPSSTPIACIDIFGLALGTTNVNLYPDMFAIGSTSTTISFNNSTLNLIDSINPNDNEIRAIMNGWIPLGNDGSRYTFWKAFNYPVSYTNTKAYPAGSATALLAGADGTAIITVFDSSIFKVGDLVHIVGSVTGTILTINGNSIELSVLVPVDIPLGRCIIKGTNSADTSLLIWCVNNVAPLCPGYHIHYELLTPESITDKNITMHGNIWNIVKGQNNILVDSGIVTNEIATAYDDNLNMLINSQDNISTRVKQGWSEAPLNTYKNGIHDPQWGMIAIQNSTCFGSLWSLPKAKFDKSSIYTIDYQIMKSLHVQRFSELSVTYTQDVFSTIDGINKALTTKQDKNDIITDIVSLTRYEEFHLSNQILRTSRTSLTGSIAVIPLQYIQREYVPNAYTMNSIISYIDDSGNTVVLPIQDCLVYVSSITINSCNVVMTYVGKNNTINNYLLNNGVNISCDVILDARQKG